MLATLLLLVACTDGASPSGSTKSSSVPSSASTEPAATAQFAFTSDNGLAGAASNLTVRCGFPDFAGPSIAVLARAPDAAVQFRVGITAGKVSVRLGSGSGADYHERAFEGPGVKGFDSTGGAQIDSLLTDAAASPGSTTGALGAVTSIKGSVDCVGQDPGSSTITVTGETAEGPLIAARLEQVRAECFNPGDEVVVLGILNLGFTKAFVEYGLRPDGIDVVETLQAGGEHRYHSPAGTATLTGQGAHASGDAVEQDAAPPHTLHVEGDAVCGTPIIG
ncbi:MAG: hypothetical protein QOC92_3148 [Acidimicrobiaceae bacterium]